MPIWIPQERYIYPEKFLFDVFILLERKIERVMQPTMRPYVDLSNQQVLPQSVLIEFLVLFHQVYSDGPPALLVTFIEEELGAPGEWLEWDYLFSTIHQLTYIDLTRLERLDIILDITETDTVVSMTFSIFIFGLILTSTFVFILSTDPLLWKSPPASNDSSPVITPFILLLEKICVILFSIEYFLRLFLSYWVRPRNVKNLLKYTLNPLYALERPGKLTSRAEFCAGIPSVLRFIFDSNNLVDLAAIFPFLMEVLLGADLGSLSFVRVFRFFRLFKVLRTSSAREIADLLGEVAIKAAPIFVVLGFYGLLVFTFFAGLMLEAERGVFFGPGAPELMALNITSCGAYLRDESPQGLGDWKVSPFDSVPQALWFVIISFTTVGYGDMTPTTVVGKAITTIIIITGVMAASLPVGIIGATFYGRYMKRIVAMDKRDRRLTSLRHLEDQLESLVPDHSEGGRLSSRKHQQLMAQGQRVIHLLQCLQAEDSKAFNAQVDWPTAIRQVKHILRVAPSSLSRSQVDEFIARHLGRLRPLYLLSHLHQRSPIALNILALRRASYDWFMSLQRQLRKA